MWRHSLVLLVMFWGGCQGGKGPSHQGVVILGDEEITLDEVESYFSQSLGETPYGASTKVLSSLLDQYIEARILASLATDQGFTHASPFRRGEAFLTQQCRKLPPPSEKVLRQYYERHKDAFALPELFYMKQIFTESSEECKGMEKALNQGKPLEELSLFSQRSTNLPPMTLSDIPEEIRDEVRQLKPGEHIPCHALGYGYLLLYLEKKDPPHTYAFEEVRDKIKDEVQRESCQRLKMKLIENFTKEHPIWVIQQNLPFSYSGRYPLFASGKP